MPRTHIAAHAAALADACPDVPACVALLNRVHVDAALDRLYPRLTPRQCAVNAILQAALRHRLRDLALRLVLPYVPHAARAAPPLTPDAYDA